MTTTDSHRDDRRHSTRPKRGTPDARTPAQRDRDRILYSSAFRRLAEVTQVVSPTFGYVFHNRLTHSLQVAQVGRRLAERLRGTHAEEAERAGGLDPDVVEAACLAHDLGHPPFGHTAEEELNALASDFGGFEGNAQSFRIVTKLAFHSENHRGLNLTRATLASVLKYPWLRNENPSKQKKWGAYEAERSDFEFATALCVQPQVRTLEADLMDWADDVTYPCTTSRTSTRRGESQYTLCRMSGIRVNGRPSSMMSLDAGRTLLSSATGLSLRKHSPT